MSRSRNLIKKIVYKFLGEKFYQRAYVRGKIRDIKSGKNLEEESQLIKHFITADSMVLDIGANYGHYTIELAKLANNGKVYAFEPVPFTFAVLKKIVTHFNASNVLLFHSAVSDQAGTLEMTLPLLDFGAPNTGVAHIGSQKNTTKSIHSKSVSVTTMKLDELGIKGRIDFIKIDIEGHEPVAFSGMDNLIRVNQPVILIEFSHTCLKRAGSDPAGFARDLSKKWNYRFARKKKSKMEWVDAENPADGYYFLIPESKLNQFNSLFDL